MKYFKKLVIIGNGMDVDHGLQTKYKQIFKEKIGEKFCSKKLKSIFYEEEFNEWNKFENTLAAVAYEYSSFFYDIKCHQSIKELNQSIKSDIYKYISSEWNKFLSTNKIDEKLKDITHEIFKILFKKIKEELKNAPERINNIKNKKKKEEMYKNLCSDAFILNYNYTTIYHNTYHDPNDCFHIHGIIDKNSNYKHDIETGFETKHNVALGTYYTNEGISSANLKKEFQDNKCKARKFSELIGNNNIFFRKGGTFTETDEIKKKKKLLRSNFENFEEVVIIGHSLSGTDLLPLQKYYDKNFKNVKKITIVDYWQAQDDKQFKKEKYSKIKKIFNTNAKIKFINNCIR